MTSSGSNRSFSNSPPRSAAGELLTGARGLAGADRQDHRMAVSGADRDRCLDIWREMHVLAPTRV
jgi:hypothetical protein